MGLSKTGKWLIIAEKPSVAQDIARALGGFTRHKDFYESERYLLSSAVGHLLELAAPSGSEPKRGKWSLENLPILPERFELIPIRKSQDRLQFLVELIAREDVTGLINACDAGREGELIFYYIITYAGCSKPIKRLWLQSMTPSAIRQAFAGLLTHEAVEGLRQAAISRAESDWLIGINATRALTALQSQGGGFRLTPAGRVQTPTLAMVVERERQIQSFTPRPYWEVWATFAIGEKPYTARWIREGEKESSDSPYRIWSRAEAEAIAARTRGALASVEETSKESQQSAPLLFDLTSLQREANQRFGFTAQQTLRLAQALYERHKLITYPRTDARALPEDMLGHIPKILEALPSPYAAFAQTILAASWVRPNKRIFDNTKISDHFAIIPTGEGSFNLNDAEAKLFDLIARRFLAVFYPAALFRLTTRLHRIGADCFKSEGKVLIQPGWMEVNGKEASDSSELPDLGAYRMLPVEAIEIKEDQTKPPARYSEATLLSAMEGAGKLLDDEALKAAMAGRGLGTPATRAQIIEGLIEDGYLVREAKELQPTPKAFSLITLLHALGIEILASPELTGEWEYRLARMERGEIARDRFMTEIRAMASEIVERVKRSAFDAIPGNYATLTAPCPFCGGVVQETFKAYQCTQCSWSVYKDIAARLLTPDEMEELLRNRRIGPLSGFRSRRGRPFSASLLLTEEGIVQFDFGASEASGSPEAGSHSETLSEPLGNCPKCNRSVVAQGAHYCCTGYLANPRQCDFRLASMILQQPITPDLVRALLERRETPLLEGFVSTRTKRRFKAHLVLQPDGSLGFRFPERSPS